MQSNQRVLLAVLLSFLVLWGYTLLVPPPKKPASATDLATTGKPAAADIASAGSSTDPPAGAGSTFERRHAGAQSLATATVSDTRNTTSSSNEACARRVQQPRRCAQELDAEEIHRPEGQSVDLVPASPAARESRPFSLGLDPARTALVNSALFHASTRGRRDATALR